MVHAGFAVVCALSGTPMLLHRFDPGPGAGWVVALIAIAAGVLVGWSARHGVRPGLRWALKVLSVLVALGAFGLLMDLLSLLFLAPSGNWAVRVNHLLAGTGAVLLTLVAGQPRTDQGRARLNATTSLAAGRTAAPPVVQVFAVIGTVAFVPYVTMKTIWAVGGTFAGVTGAEVLARSAANGASGPWLLLESAGLDPTVLLAGLGVFLLWGLARPWGVVFPGWLPILGGCRVPRWLPLAPAIVGASTLAVYGVIGLGYLSLVTAGVLPIRIGDLPDRDATLIVSWIGMTAFAGFGVGLAVAAMSYWRRTRLALSAV